MANKGGSSGSEKVLGSKKRGYEVGHRITEGWRKVQGQAYRYNTPSPQSHKYTR